MSVNFVIGLRTRPVYLTELQINYCIISSLYLIASCHEFEFKNNFIDFYIVDVNV